MDKLWHIKVRQPGAKRWYFISPRKGGTNALRIHACQYQDDRVDLALAGLRKDNPTLEFKKQKVSRSNYRATHGELA